MRVDVVQRVRVQPRGLQRRLHRPAGAVAVLGGGGDVVGVAGQAVAHDLGIDLGTPGLGVLVFLENDDAGTLAHDEAVAVGVIGARGLLWLVGPLGGQGLAGVEASDADLADRRLGPARDHHVGVAVADQAHGVADGMGAGRAGGDDRMVRTLEAVADADLPRDQVDQGAGHEEGGHAPGPLLFHHHGGVGDGVEPADARADQDAGPLAALVVLRRPAAVLDGLLRGGHAEEDEGVDLPLLLGLHVGVGVEGPIRAVAQGHLAGVGGGQPLGIEAGDRLAARLARQDAAPAFLDPIRQRRDKAQSGNDDTAHILPSPSHLFGT